MNMSYIRQTCGIPARRGARARNRDERGDIFEGRIPSARDSRLRMLVDALVPGYRGRLNLPPTWRVEYLPAT